MHFLSKKMNLGYQYILLVEDKSRVFEANGDGGSGAAEFNEKDIMFDSKSGFC